MIIVEVSPEEIRPGHHDHASEWEAPSSRYMLVLGNQSVSEGQRNQLMCEKNWVETISANDDQNIVGPCVGSHPKRVPFFSRPLLRKTTRVSRHFCWVRGQLTISTWTKTIFGEEILGLTPKNAAKCCLFVVSMTEGSLEVKLPIKWTNGKAEVGSRETLCFAPCFVAPQGRKLGLVNRLVRSHLGDERSKKCTRAKHISKSYHEENTSVRSTFGS